jgi:hypothetical protein
MSHKQTAKDAPWEDKTKPFDENMYKYHENTHEYDPQAQPFSYFYVTIAG